MSNKTIHLVGNAHIDPVWLWRFQDGFSEIKATFRSALDRIREYDDFVFSSACASYYKWIEENCPPMFEEIKEAVKNGKWIIVGGMWIQPDCNIPSSESFARQLLYSQKYFEEKFGITAKTGYNVDSFGHSAGLPRLLRNGGIENYVFMRPSVAEKKYPFPDRAFKWNCGENEVLTYRLPSSYANNFSTTDQIENQVRASKDHNYPQMVFFGVGNHGGGPTITNIETIHEYQAANEGKVEISNPDKFFDVLRADHLEEIPEYTGDLHNHASGCYSANSMIKKLNREENLEGKIIMCAKEGENYLGAGALELNVDKVYLNFLVTEEEDLILKLGIIKSLLNLADLRGIKTVYGNNKELASLYKMTRFKDDGDEMKLDLEGYFTSGC